MQENIEGEWSVNYKRGINKATEALTQTNEGMRDRRPERMTKA